jgi:hypothetical protein
VAIQKLIDKMSAMIFIYCNVMNRSMLIREKESNTVRVHFGEPKSTDPGFKPGSFIFTTLVRLDRQGLAHFRGLQKKFRYC